MKRDHTSTNEMEYLFPKKRWDLIPECAPGATEEGRNIISKYENDSL